MADALLLPPPLAGDERFQALGQLAARISDIDLSPLLVYLVDTVNASALPNLAEQLHILGEGWQFARNDAERRRMIKRAVELHRYKGTPFAVKSALELAGIDVGLVEWFQQVPPGEPCTFIADFPAQPAVESSEAFARATALIDDWKPVSRHYSCRVSAVSESSFSVDACGTVSMQCSGVGELMAQPLRGDASGVVAAGGIGFMLVAGKGLLHKEINV